MDKKSPQEHESQTSANTQDQDVSLSQTESTTAQPNSSAKPQSTKAKARAKAKQAAAAKTGAQAETSTAEPETTDTAQENPQSTSEPAAPQHGQAAQMQPAYIAMPQQKNTGLLLLIFLFILISLAAAAASVYLFTRVEYQEKQNLQLQNSIQSSVQQSLAQSAAGPEAQISQLSREHQALANEVKPLATQQRLQMEFTQQLSQQVNNLTQGTPDHWVIAEAKYLLSLAQRKIALENDITTAMLLLQAAEQRLAQSTNAEVLPLRQAIAKDLAQLALLKPLDLVGIALAIDQVLTKVPEMRLNQKTQELHRQQVVLSQDLSTDLNDWQQNLSKTWHALLSDFVVVQKRQPHTDITPLLPPEEEFYLYENIRSKLIQAQYALYRYDAKNYRSSLTLARSWIHQYLDVNQMQVKAALGSLDTLLKVEVTSESQHQLESVPAVEKLHAQSQQSLYMNKEQL